MSISYKFSCLGQIANPILSARLAASDLLITEGNCGGATLCVILVCNIGVGWRKKNVLNKKDHVSDSAIFHH